MSTRRSMAQTRGGVAAPQQQNSYAQQQAQQQQQSQARQALLQQQQAQEQKPVITQIVTDENGVKKQKPDWQLRKVDPVTRRLRQNARVKKVVKPKPANMVLHEMYPDIVYKIDEVASNKTSIYRVHFELKGKNFSGEGFSKSMAKVNACEQALKALLMEKLAKEAEEDKAKEKEGEAMEVEGSATKVPATDDFPWAKMASFALQKLMDSWTGKTNEQEPGNFIKAGGPQGPYGGHQTFSHPNHVSFSNFNPGFNSGYPAQPFKPQGPKVQAHPRKKFPENPLEYNPVALFNQTWPNTEPTFDAISKEGGVEHTATIVLEGFRFSASAKSKKEVKVQIAKAIISTLKGVKYPDGFTAQVQHA